MANWQRIEREGTAWRFNLYKDRTMKKFDVHVYIPVRFKVAGIEAADHKEAAPKENSND